METLEKRLKGKRETRKEERQLAILEVAKRSFLENGYTATSMSAISAELGGSKGTLWSYFPSKTELFAAVLDRATISYRQQLGDLLEPSADLYSTIFAFTRSFIQKVTSPEAIRLHRVVAAESGRSPEVGDIFYRRAPQPTQQLIADFFDGQMRDGHMRCDDALSAARVLTSLCMGGMHQRLLFGVATDAEEVEREARYVADVFARAFDIAEGKPNQA